LTGEQLANGPAKLCQALGIDRAWNGHNLSAPPLQLVVRPQLPQTEVVQSTRIGISQAQDKPWRWYIAGNRFVSKT
jgi:DNA-3-methyladenine glycosylase